MADETSFTGHCRVGSLCMSTSWDAVEWPDIVLSCDHLNVPDFYGVQEERQVTINVRI